MTVCFPPLRFGLRVRFPAKRTFYKRVLDQVLFQARLEAELRVDDANRPFIWVTTIGAPQRPDTR